MTKPTEDTPRYRLPKNIKWAKPKILNDPESITDVQSGQGDRQLREAIEALVETYENTDADIVAENIMQLFAKEQIQLVSELEGELPKTLTPITTHIAGHNTAIEEVKTLLQHKKQELEGKI